MNEILKSLKPSQIAHMGVNFLRKSAFKQFFSERDDIEYTEYPYMTYNLSQDSQRQEFPCDMNPTGMSNRHFKFFVDVEPGDNVLRIYSADYWGGWSHVQMEDLYQQGRTRTNKYITYKSDKKKKVAIYAVFYTAYRTDCRLYLTSKGVERQLHCEELKTLGYGWNMGLSMTMTSNYSGGWNDKETMADVSALLQKSNLLKNRAVVIDREEQEYYDTVDYEEALYRVNGYIKIPDNMKIKLEIGVAKGTLITIGDKDYAWQNPSTWSSWKTVFVDLSDKKTGELIKITAIMAATKHSGGRSVMIRPHISRDDGATWSFRRAIPGLFIHKDEQIIEGAWLGKVISHTAENVSLKVFRLYTRTEHRDSEIILDAKGYDIFGVQTPRSDTSNVLREGTLEVHALVGSNKTEIFLGNVIYGNYAVPLPKDTQKVILRGHYTGVFNTHDWFKARSVGLYKKSDWDKYLKMTTPTTNIKTFTAV